MTLDYKERLLHMEKEVHKLVKENNRKGKFVYLEMDNHPWSLIFSLFKLLTLKGQLGEKNSTGEKTCSHLQITVKVNTEDRLKPAYFKTTEKSFL